MIAIAHSIGSTPRRSRLGPRALKPISSSTCTRRRRSAMVAAPACRICKSFRIRSPVCAGEASSRIATERADALGITSGDLVEVSSEWGTVEAAAFVTPGIHPGVVAIAAGQGHTHNGRYANHRGVNAYSLLGQKPDGTSVNIRKVSS